MSKLIVAYWSQTGNTESMANAIAKGAAEAGREAEALEISNVSLEDLKNSTSFALGCPAMGAEVLEEDEMEPFVQEVETFVNGKQIALFGSYGWGGGEWMRDWEERMKNAGASIVGGEGLITKEVPDDETIAKCEELGKQLASL